jgi:hypothetical protein
MHKETVYDSHVNPEPGFYSDPGYFADAELVAPSLFVTIPVPLSGISEIKTSPPVLATKRPLSMLI